MSGRHPTDRPPAPAWLVWAALIVVYLVWGSTYLAIRVVVESMPPFLAAGVRFGLAGVILAVALALRSGPGRLRATRAQLLGAAFVGFTLLCIGNGLVSVGEQTVPSGLAALIIGVVPIFVLVLRRLAGEPLSAVGVGGVVLGFIGLGVLVVPGGSSGTIDLIGAVALVLASASWAIGSFVSRGLALPSDALVSTCYQLLFGSVMLLGVGTVLGEWGPALAGGFSEASLWSLAYLVVFGSLLAYTAYTWLLQNAPIARVATYAYVNPVVAVILGWALLSETVDATMLIGAAMIVTAVAVITGFESRRPARPPVPEGPSAVAEAASGRR